MQNQFDHPIETIRIKIYQQKKLQAAKQDFEKRLRSEKILLAELEKSFKKEERDLQHLEGLSLSGIFYTILGSKVEQTEKERQEFLAAKLKYDRCCHSITYLTQQIELINQELDDLNALDRQYQQLLNQKEQQILQSNDPLTEQLAQVTNQIADARIQQKELDEAQAACKKSLQGLDRVIGMLKSADSWGVWDMVGGGLFTGIAKHSRLDDARNEIDELQKSLWQLQQELEDVGAKEMLKIDISSLDRFADLFFDNLITDWVVQSRIRTSLDQAHQLKTSIQPIQKHLQQRSHALQVSVSQLHSERETLLTK